jgi:pantoate--beta-alanine ligase
MKIIQTVSAMKQEIRRLKKAGLKIGFVPTMGALHDGHLSLVATSKEECDETVVSIFVNPTQFNNRSDFENYPVTLEKDLAMLISVGCDLLFLPDEQDMYPEPDQRKFEFDGLDQVMEGAFRPGHFNGVAQIVSKLFDAVEPDIAFFGQKDFQQLAIIRKMVEKYRYPVTIEGCPIVREPDGLAMSSRNLRLTPGQRKKAALLSEVLFEAASQVGKINIPDLKKTVQEKFSHDPEYRFEYFEIVDSSTLRSLENWEETDSRTACIAVFVGEIRLIDNITL